MLHDLGVGQGLGGFGAVFSCSGCILVVFDGNGLVMTGVVCICCVVTEQ